MRLIALFVILAAGVMAAENPKVIHDFGATNNFTGGSSLYAGLALDPEGNLYGVAAEGGKPGYGVAFELSRDASGKWSETVLHNFKGGSGDGANPHAALFRDSAGNLYGTTVSGGLGTKLCRGGCGVVFKLTPGANGWQESILYRFTGGADGGVPYAGVVLDAAGSLYGATTKGGSAGVGAVYKLAPGPVWWQESVIWSFDGPDGITPFGTPVLDGAGNLYGTTLHGGGHNQGVVYELSPQAGGAWGLTVLHHFKGGTDGGQPLVGLTIGPDDALYGTTSEGGTANCGIAYRLAPRASGGWEETILHNFLGIHAQDGAYPNGLTFDAHGNLFGTTSGGGTDNPGTIFEISPAHGGGWQETVLFNFTNGPTGVYPFSTLAIDAAGRLYGTSLWGGPSGDTTGGIAFEFTPE